MNFVTIYAGWFVRRLFSGGVFCKIAQSKHLYSGCNKKVVVRYMALKQELWLNDFKGKN